SSNNNVLYTIDGNDALPRLPKEHSLAYTDISEKTLYDITAVLNTTTDTRQLFAVGGSGRFFRVNQSMTQASVTSQAELDPDEDARELEKKLRVVVTAHNGSEIWTAGGSGALGVYNRTTNEITSFRKQISGSNTIYDIVVFSQPGKRIVYSVAGKTRVRRTVLSVNTGASGQYTVTNTTTIEVPASNGIKAIAKNNNTIYVGGKKDVFRSAAPASGWSRVGSEIKPAKRITEIQVVNKNLLYIARKNGKILRSNGDLFISHTLSRNGNKLRDLSLLNDTQGSNPVVGMAATKSGGAAIYVRQLSDGEWELYDAGIDKTLYGIVALEPHLGFAVGGNGRIYRLDRTRPVQGSNKGSPRFKTKGIFGVIDLDEDGRTELIYQGSSGYVRQLDDNESRIVLSTNNRNFGVSHAATGIRDVDEDGYLDLVFVDGNNRLRIFGLQTRTSVTVGADPP
ncbi:MAG: hypothetical protein ABEI52_02480, partial [Halobacteriaceae archaeon]